APDVRKSKTRSPAGAVDRCVVDLHSSKCASEPIFHAETQAVVIDLFSRRVVGWSMSANMTAQLVTDALIMAIWRRGKPDALLHHSDQGSQYTSEQFQRLMADHGITCSMSRSGNVWDNAAMESCFSSLKTERTARKVYRTRDDAKADVFDYVERFYNPKRRHSILGYLSPMEFEIKVGLA
ncbi:IS3 family transposase, partial [Rhizobium sp. AC27/96]|uniref:IS3 family transposase n=1 Tax=Rhizobium sp. AC27/96 TaxID=1841653 RepID=UPI001FCDF0AC